LVLGLLPPGGFTPRFFVTVYWAEVAT